MFNVNIERRNDGIVVVVTTTGLDRSDVSGWILGPNREALAERLARGIRAGAVLTNPTVRTDVFGKTYLSCTNNVLGRSLNADLKRLGF